jgi:hypothetical protein
LRQAQFEAGQFEAGQFEAELIAFCRERLAGFETPKAIVVVEALPETVGGKVLKYKLREQFAGHFQAAVGPDPGSIDSPDNRVRLCVVDRQDPAPLTLHSRRGRCP